MNGVKLWNQYCLCMETSPARARILRVLSVQESLLIPALFMQTFYLLPAKNPAKKKGFAFKLEQEPVVNARGTMPKTRGHAEGSTWCLIPY